MQYSGRIRFFSIAIFIFGLLLIGRLYILQIVNGGDYLAQADKQYVRSTYDYYDRGSIFFSTKDGALIPAASLKNGFILTVHPDEVIDPEVAFTRLNEVYTVDQTDFLAKANKVGDPEERIAPRLSKDTADKIKAAKIPGIHLAEERWRFYPGIKSAAHTLGFIGFDNNDDLNGRYGLERFYEETLGRDNKTAYANFFVEVFSGLKKAITSEQKFEGDIITTIEPTVEHFLEEKLQEIINTWDSDYAGGIVMDPNTGEIFAMALAPTFDPNNLKEEKSVDVFQNKLVESVYEMGSIIKPLTIASAIDDGVITPETRYFDAGYIVLNNKTISNFDHKGRGNVSMQEVLNQSLNTGVVFAMQKMGIHSFSKYMKSFAFGDETGIDLPNEVHGLTDNLDSPREVEHATASFGQGIAMTPIETIRALSALGNGGTLPNPHLVKKITYKLGGEKTIVSNPNVQVLKKETSDEITRMLVNVVDEALLHGTVSLPNYSIAAKTGTAQVVEGGKYSEDKFLHSFFGYFPAYKPRFIVFLFNMHPKGVQYASETLTHPFIDMAKFLINYYELPPDRGKADSI